MGEKKRRGQRRQLLLSEHPNCIYCGAVATTIDHCPPRSFFLNRQWPEFFEFPSCGTCNSGARQDEQVLSVLARLSLTLKTGIEKSEFERAVAGLRNNQPDVVAEWLSMTRNEVKHSLREAFGDGADDLRRGGWGAIYFGKITNCVLERFMVKLGQALYFHHTRQPLRGVVYCRHVNSLNEAASSDHLKIALEKAPILAIPTRNGKSLESQFVYRFNCDAEYGALNAVVQFNPQIMFHILVARQDLADRLEGDRVALGLDLYQSPD